MFKFIIDDKIPFLKGVFEPFAEVNYFPGEKITPEKIKNADALIIRTRTICNEELLLGSNVKMIASATIGFDHIDKDYCSKNGIKWTNAPGCNSGSVMQFMASVLVRLSQKHNFRFSEKTLGIIGVGNVGAKVAKLADALGMKVLLNDPPRERKEGKGNFVSIEEIQEKADIISFHVPLIREGIDKTYHMFDDSFIAALKNKPIILNSSRGEVLDESVLKNGLKEGKIESAVLDVWENEPDIDLELLDLVDIATPHIAGYSAEGKLNGTKMVIEAVSAHFNLDIEELNPLLLSNENLNVEINCKGKLDEEIFSEAILHTYDVLNDNERFRESPTTFEKQRGNYPIRREFQAHTLMLKNCKPHVSEKLKQLGFSI